MHDRIGGHCNSTVEDEASDECNSPGEALDQRNHPSLVGTTDPVRKLLDQIGETGKEDGRERAPVYSAEVAHPEGHTGAETVNQRYGDDEKKRPVARCKMLREVAA